MGFDLAAGENFKEITHMGGWRKYPRKVMNTKTPVSGNFFFVGYWDKTFLI
ncbi:MAG: hypothetical protein CM15mP130_0990 [Verrucomicrobiota bacterium]|nr:MAG: hypothetical protein CM15mP130_0990 [Verrucomicrobiota bacterium]